MTLLLNGIEQNRISQGMNRIEENRILLVQPFSLDLGFGVRGPDFGSGVRSQYFES